MTGRLILYNYPTIPLHGNSLSSIIENTVMFIGAKPRGDFVSVPQITCLLIPLHARTP